MCPLSTEVHQRLQKPSSKTIMAIKNKESHWEITLVELEQPTQGLVFLLWDFDSVILK
jgi:hypothetical protein